MNCGKFVIFDDDLNTAIAESFEKSYTLYTMADSDKKPTVGTIGKALDFLKKLLPVESNDEVYEPLKLKRKEEYNKSD